MFKYHDFSVLCVVYQSCFRQNNPLASTTSCCTSSKTSAKNKGQPSNLRVSSCHLMFCFFFFLNKGWIFTYLHIYIFSYLHMFTLYSWTAVDVVARCASSKETLILKLARAGKQTLYGFCSLIRWGVPLILFDSWWLVSWKALNFNAQTSPHTLHWKKVPQHRSEAMEEMRSERQARDKRETSEIQAKEKTRAEEAAKRIRRIHSVYTQEVLHFAQLQPPIVSPPWAGGALAQSCTLLSPKLWFLRQPSVTPGGWWICVVKMPGAWTSWAVWIESSLQKHSFGHPP